MLSQGFAAIFALQKILNTFLLSLATVFSAPLWKLMEAKGWEISQEGRPSSCSSLSVIKLRAQWEAHLHTLTFLQEGRLWNSKAKFLPQCNQISEMRFMYLQLLTWTQDRALNWQALVLVIGWIHYKSPFVRQIHFCDLFYLGFCCLSLEKPIKLGKTFSWRWSGVMTWGASENGTKLRLVKHQQIGKEHVNEVHRQDWAGENGYITKTVNRNWESKTHIENNKWRDFYKHPAKYVWKKQFKKHRHVIR